MLSSASKFKGTAPVASDTAPVASDTASVASDTASVASDTAPIASDTAPVASDTAPVASDTAPIANDVAPSVDAASGTSMLRYEYGYELPKIERSLLLPVTIAGHEAEALVDNGAEIDIISARLVER
jgi:hypothetical protein